MSDLNDYNQPTITSTRVDVQDTNRASHIRAITLDPGTAANRPTNAKRASFASSIFLLENWSGSAWVEWFRATVFGRSLASAADAATARTTLGATTVGGNLFTASDAAAARSAISVSPRATRIDVASATTVDLTANSPNCDDIRITGAVAITGVTIAAGRVVRVTFSGAATLTNNANIITQEGTNIVTAAGDTCIWRATAANTIEVLCYRGRASETQAGALELASPSEASGLAVLDRAISPARLKDAFGATGSAPMFACRAWVNFNGTGTVAIRASGNVSSITDNGVGDYTVNFLTALPDADYAWSLSCNGNGGGMQAGAQLSGTPSSPTLISSSQMRFNTGATSGGANIDMSHVSAAFFR